MENLYFIKEQDFVKGTYAAALPPTRALAQVAVADVSHRLACLESSFERIIRLMVHKLLLTAILIVALVPVFAEEGPPQIAKVVSIQKHPQGRIAFWEGRTPVFDGNPVYDITIQWNNKQYLVRYESLTGYYPKAWEIGNEIPVKKERGRFILYRGDEPVPAREISSHDCVQATLLTDLLPSHPRFLATRI